MPGKEGLTPDPSKFVQREMDKKPFVWGVKRGIEYTVSATEVKQGKTIVKTIGVIEHIPGIDTETFGYNFDAPNVRPEIKAQQPAPEVVFDQRELVGAKS